MLLVATAIMFVIHGAYSQSTSLFHVIHVVWSKGFIGACAACIFNLPSYFTPFFPAYYGQQFIVLRNPKPHPAPLGDFFEKSAIDG